MQIGCLEPGQLLQLLPLQEMDIGSVHGEKTVSPQILKHSVDVHRRDAKAIRHSTCVIGSSNSPSLVRPTALSLRKSSTKKWAILAVADLRPTLTIHSLNIAASINVSRQSAAATFGRSLFNCLNASCGTKPRVQGVSVTRS